MVVVLIPEPVPKFIPLELFCKETREGGTQHPSINGLLRQSTGIQVNIVWTSV